jgi:hypothetical protein
VVVGVGDILLFTVFRPWCEYRKRSGGTLVMGMTVKDYVSGSCAGGEIISLSTQKDAKDAMRCFCRAVLGARGGPTTGLYRSSSQPKYNCTASHYVFIAGAEKDSDGGKTQKAWPNYGSDFAQYILDEKLGLIATLPKTRNRKYHPETTCQIWIWQPDQLALEKWWDGESAHEIAEEKKKAAALRAAQEKTVAAIRAKFGPDAKIIKVFHHGARPSNAPAPNGIDTHVGKTVTFIEVRKSDRYTYHNTYEGMRNYTVVQDGFDLPEVGKAYTILDVDHNSWTLVLDPDSLKKGKK